MLQRVQSIFLLGVALCMGLLLVTDIWEETLPDQNRRIELDAYALQTASLSNADEGSLHSGAKTPGLLPLSPRYRPLWPSTKFFATKTDLPNSSWASSTCC